MELTLDKYAFYENIIKANAWYGTTAIDFMEVEELDIYVFFCDDNFSEFKEGYANIYNFPNDDKIKTFTRSIVTKKILESFGARNITYINDLICPKLSLDKLNSNLYFDVVNYAKCKKTKGFHYFHYTALKNRDLSFAWIGEFEESLNGSIMIGDDEYKIPPNLEMIPLGALYENLSIVNNSKLFLCTSIEETMPLEILFTMQLNKPIVCFSNLGDLSNLMMKYAFVLNGEYKGYMLDQFVKEFFKDPIESIDYSEYTKDFGCPKYLKEVQEMMKV